MLQIAMLVLFRPFCYFDIMAHDIIQLIFLSKVLYVMWTMI